MDFSGIARDVIAAIVVTANLTMFGIQFRERQQERKRRQLAEKKAHRLRRIASVRDGADKLFQGVVLTGLKLTPESLAVHGMADSQLQIAAELLQDERLVTLMSEFEEALGTYTRTLQEANNLVDVLVQLDGITAVHAKIGVYCEELVEKVANDTKY